MPRSSHDERKAFLYSRGARAWLGAAAALTIGAATIMHSDLSSETFGTLNHKVLAGFAVVCAVGYVCLLAGMAIFWRKYDESSKTSRTLWFAVLLLGFAYGSQVAYYAFVYWPAVTRRLRDPRAEAAVCRDLQDGTSGRAMRVAGWVLLAGWALFILFAAVYSAFRVPMYHLFYPRANALVMWLASLVAGTVLYAIATYYWLGIRRPAGTAYSN